MRRAALFAASAPLAFLAVTLVALEGSEVVRLRTFPANQEPLVTRVWIADADGHAWIEAASSERAFYQHILAHPEVEMERNGTTRRYRAEPIAGRAGHEKIRSLLRAKYGWADRWIGMLTDTSHSIALRLHPAGDIDHSHPRPSH